MRSFLFLSLCFFLFASCGKEYSYEGGPPLPPADTIKTAQGYLGGAPNACTPVTIYGTYEKGFAFDSAQHIKVQATITHAGSYTVYTNTVNGIYFKDSGTIAANGTYMLNLKAYGTPIQSGNFVFTVRLNNSACTFTLQVSEAKVSGGDYFPDTPGSWWKYLSIDNTTPMGWNCTNFKRTYNGHVYSVFTRTIDNPLAGSRIDTAFFRKENGNYIEYGNSKGLIGLFTFAFSVLYQNREIVFLKDYLPVGGAWNSDTLHIQSTDPVVDYLIFQRFEIVAKDVSLNTINGLSFYPVITVKVSMYRNNLDGQGFQQGGDLYYFSYAKNIGYIQRRTSNTFQTSYNEYITDYHIQ